MEKQWDSPIDAPSARFTNSLIRRALNNPWFWLASASFFLLFAGGRNNIALAAWLAPLCLLRFLRLRPTKMGFLLAWLTVLFFHGFALRGVVPIPGIAYDIIFPIMVLAAMLPYGVDAWLSPRLSGISRTLVFPIALVTLDFMNVYGMHGSWGSPAYTQYGNLPLLQLLSVTGLWGITFLMGWFAAVANEAMESGEVMASGLPSQKTFRPVAIFAIAYLTIIFLGDARLALFPPSSPTVRVAAITASSSGPEMNSDVLQHVILGTATPMEFAAFDASAKATQDNLLMQSDREAQAGAKVIFWPEGNAPVLKQNEAALIARGQALAARDHIYLGMTLATWRPGEKHSLENKLVWIEPTGNVAWQFLKAHPTPGPEVAMAVRGDGKLHSSDTPYGRWSAAICYDADFPQIMAQAGAMGADIVALPASDWRAIDPMHTQMASYRAIEQGFNLVRQANLGLSAAYDYQGHQLAAMDYFHTEDRVLIAQVPTRGVRTIYSRLGNWLAWLCIATLAGLIAVAYRKGK